MLAVAAIALAFALVPVARADVKPRIVNGTDATIEQFPFQVLLFNASMDPSNGRFCGGVVEDATHVITAAHCVFDIFRPSQVSLPTDQQVFAGSADLSDTGITPTDVSALAFDPQYDPSTSVHDVALLTLASALYTGTPSQNGTDKIAPITIAGSQPAAGTNLTVSGWGDQTAEPPDGSGTPFFTDILQKATVPLVDDDTCVGDYGSAGVPVDKTLLFCAGDGPSPITDSCQGDSGGPIVTGSAGGYTLLGLVDSGIGCAQAGFPGIYTRLVNTDLQAWLNSNPPAAPSQTSPTTLSGGNSAGQTLTCASGDWAGSQTSFTYRFFRVGSGTPLTDATSTNTYTVHAGDTNTRIQCEVEAKNGGGFGFAESNSVLIAIPPPPTATTDTTAPKLHVASKKCTKTRCTIRVKVTDAAPSSGVARVKATLSFKRKVRCRRTSTARAAKTCTKRVARTLKVTGGGGGQFTVVANHLAPAKGYTISLVPFDKAGNRPLVATITSVRTKPGHSRGRF